MSSANAFAPPDQNLLLQTLPHDVRERVSQRLTLVRLEHKQTLYEPDSVIRHVYFPLNGIASLLAVMGDGDMIEVGTTGNEGMVGTPLILGVPTSAQEAIAQVPGDALSMGADAFVEEIERHDAFDRIVRRYLYGYINMVSQTAACNRLHEVDSRCARWLLMTHDRANSDTFPLTHEFLSSMLGVRRAGVTVALGMLRRAGMITSTPGTITIVDRHGLEDAACECYQLVRDDFDQLLG